jgi:hypothetical protein
MTACPGTELAQLRSAFRPTASSGRTQSAVDTALLQFFFEGQPHWQADANNLTESTYGNASFRPTASDTREALLTLLALPASQCSLGKKPPCPRYALRFIHFICTGIHAGDHWHDDDAGYLGEACSRCAPSFYRSDQSCVPCPHTAELLVAGYVLGLGKMLATSPSKFRGPGPSESKSFLRCQLAALDGRLQVVCVCVCSDRPRPSCNRPTKRRERICPGHRNRLPSNCVHVYGIWI